MPFDFSVNTNSGITAGNAITPFDFSGAAASTFEVSLAGSSVASENQTVSISLDSSIATLQDLISRAEAMGYDPDRIRTVPQSWP